MKLQQVPARTGLDWVRSGVRVFFKQPLAVTGLFFMFMAVMSVLALLPALGLPLALMVLPTTTLGLMAAAREVGQGRFPMPLMLFVGLRAPAAVRHGLLVLGVVYALGFALALATSYAADGGEFARLYLGGQAPDDKTLAEGLFLTGMLAFLAVHLPVSLALWHAPALVYWHGASPAKSIFFSWVACWRNLGAFMTFGASWLAALVAVVMAVMMLGGLLGAPALSAGLLLPVLLWVASMFFASLYASFRGCFPEEPPPSAAPAATEPPQV